MGFVHRRNRRNRDRISNLPDTVLHHILSFLPTKYSVRTSILSRRWKFLWTYIPNLYFEYYSLEHPSINLTAHRICNLVRGQRFADFVFGVLFRHHVSSIQKFQLTCGDDCKDPVYTWIFIAIERNVQELILELRMKEPVKLPYVLFTSKMLVQLNLSSGIVLDVPISVCLPSLKILGLFSVQYTSDDTAKNLLKGCPVLEELIIRRETLDKRNFNVSSPTLKILKIDFHVNSALVNDSDDHEYKLVVNAPVLGYLKLNDFVSEDYLIDNLSSLVQVHINVRPRHKLLGHAIHKLLIGVSNVKFLSLSSETLYSLRNIDGYKLPTFYNVTHLELSLKGNYGWRLTNFLESSPNLQVLVLFEIYTDMDIPEDWTPPQHVPTCLELHLTEIEIHEIHGDRYMLGMIGFLLENSKVLKKLTIDCQDLDFEKQSWVVKELVSFPRGSSSCQLNLLE